jgi:glutathione S-transferase
MIRILGRKSSSNVQKVLWCCAEIGLAHEREDVGAQYGRNRTPEYLTLNPNGLVPTMIEDDFVLWESNAIVRYLASQYGNGRLWPSDPRVAASASRWMDWQLSALAAPLAVLYRSLLKRGEQLSAAEVMAAKQRANAMWTLLDGELAKSRYVAGSELTVGDIAFGNSIARWYAVPLERPELPNLRAWFERLSARPAFRASIEV